MREFRTVPDADSAGAAFHALYGPWATVVPRDVPDVLNNFTRPWWIAGGWAIDAFTGTVRSHEDIDVGIFRDDVPALREAMIGHLHVWSVGPDGLRPITDEQPLPASADQIWLRADASSPWLVDILLTPQRHGQWVNRRDRTLVAPLTEVTWTDRDGIRYLKPEHVLAFKAKWNADGGGRSKDVADFERAWPALGVDARRLLTSFLTEHHPDHPWLAYMR